MKRKNSPREEKRVKDFVGGSRGEQQGRTGLQLGALARDHNIDLVGFECVREGGLRGALGEEKSPRGFQGQPSPFPVTGGGYVSPCRISAQPCNPPCHDRGMISGGAGGRQGGGGVLLPSSYHPRRDLRGFTFLFILFTAPSTRRVRLYAFSAVGRLHRISSQIGRLPQHF